MAILPSDANGTQAVIKGVAANIAAILPYVQAVQAIQLGAQPLIVDGTSCGSYDPLGGAPAAEAAIAIAQSHCQAFSNSTLSGLAVLRFSIAGATGSANGSGILNDLATMAGIQSTQNPTTAQQATFYAALNDIATRIATLEDAITSIQNGAQTFQAGMSADVQAFTNGSASLAATQTQMAQSYENECVQFSMGPLGGAICSVLGSIYGAMNADLQTLQNGINTSVASEGSVVPALSKLQDLFSGLKFSYSDVALEVKKASQQQFNSIMQQIDVSVLSQYWQDTEIFAANNGFGAPRL